MAKDGGGHQLYVRICLTCQLEKIERKKQAGILQPLSILERQWEFVSMDFIMGMLEVDNLGSILVVVDRFSKYVIFMAIPQLCTANAAVKLFLKNVLKIFGLFKDVISDCNARFTGKF